MKVVKNSFIDQNANRLLRLFNKITQNKLREKQNEKHDTSKHLTQNEIKHN